MRLCPFLRLVLVVYWRYTSAGFPNYLTVCQEFFLVPL